jgi:transcriptional regulator with XRE-family HTH domain
MADDVHRSTPLFRALLKHWRAARGMSQLDLAVTADVSARHISFLETGRAQPSRDMVLRLATTLGLELRAQNELLAAVGMPLEHSESPSGGPLAASVERAIERMLRQQEPYPLFVLNRHYDVVRANDPGVRIFSTFIAEPEALGQPPNELRAAFDPRLMRPFVIDWPRLARATLARLQREALNRPNDDDLRALIDEVLQYPGVPGDWRQPDLSTTAALTLTFALARDALQLEFLATITVFNDPRDVTLEELKLASYFPVDARTEAYCKALAR